MVIHLPGGPYGEKLLLRSLKISVADWLAVEEAHRHSQQPAPIPRHPTVEKTVVDWGQLRGHKSATRRSAVAFFFFFLHLVIKTKLASG